MEFVSEDPVGFVRKLKASGEPGSGKPGTSVVKTSDPGDATGNDIWLIGGGQVNTLFLNAGLIDELFLFVMPVVLPDGIDLFNGVPMESALQLFDSKSWPNGVMEMRYSCPIK